MKEHKYSLLVILVSVYLAFQGLGNNYFWCDESNTAIFASNLLKTGTLTGWDGRNLYAFNNGAELGADLTNTYQPPLQYYIGALSFLVFGSTTFAARLPFVIIGLLSLLALLSILNEEFHNRELNAAALVFLGFSVSFLLYIRQARYYALTILLPLIVYLGFKRYIRTSRRIFLVYMTLGATAFFYSAYFICAGFLAALTVVYFAFYYRKENIKPLLASLFSFLILTVPHVLYMKPYARVKDIFPPGSRSWIADKVTLLLWSIRELNDYGWFPWIAAVGLAYFLITAGRNDRLASVGREWVLLAVSFIFFVTILSPQPVYDVTEIADVRYLVALLPFLAGLGGILLLFLKQKSRFLFLGLLPVLVFTNLLSVSPLNTSVRFDLVNYIHEVHNDYTTPYEAVVELLDQDAGKDDTLYAFPEFMNYPILFYAGDRVRICGQLNKATKIPMSRLKSLDAPFFVEEETPDWIILFVKCATGISMVEHFSRNGTEYELYRVLDVYGRDMTRPEIPWRSFGPKKDFDHDTEGIHVFRKLGSAG